MSKRAHESAFASAVPGVTARNFLDAAYPQVCY
jgi:hypothetical protein